MAAELQVGDNFQPRWELALMALSDPLSIRTVARNEVDMPRRSTIPTSSGLPATPTSFSSQTEYLAQCFQPIDSSSLDGSGLPNRTRAVSYPNI